MSPSKTDTRRGIQSIETGFRILSCLERVPQALSLTEIAKGTRMSPSRVQFYLVSLLRVGMVEQEGPGGSYRLGPMALRLGVSALAQIDVIEAARAQLSQLRDRTGDTVYVSVWGSHGPTVVNRLDGQKVAPLEVRVGAVMPLVSSATGKTFLAYLPRPVTAKPLQREIGVLRKNGGSRVSASDIDGIINEVKSYGVARTRGGVIPGIVAIASPVVDYEGRLRCVITMMGHEGVLDVDYESDATRALMDAARSASHACGFAGNIWHVPPTRRRPS